MKVWSANSVFPVSVKWLAAASSSKSLIGRGKGPTMFFRVTNSAKYKFSEFSEGRLENLLKQLFQKHTFAQFGGPGGFWPDAFFHADIHLGVDLDYRYGFHVCLLL